MELGIYTFAELTPDPATGRTIDPATAAAQPARGDRARRPGRPRRLRRRRAPPPRLRVSAPAVVLAAAAERTKRIRLTSAVSVLSSDDPVRVFQDFATLDLLSGGRAEIMAGRGSFIESFPLFGYDLNDYDELFAEKLELLLALRDSERVTWCGQASRRRSTTSASTRGRSRSRCRSGSRSAARPSRPCAPALLGLPMALAIIGGLPGALRALRRAPPRGRDAAPATTRRSRSASTRTASSPRPRRPPPSWRFPRVLAADEQDRPRTRLAADDAPGLRSEHGRSAARTSSAARPR